MIKRNCVWCENIFYTYPCKIKTGRGRFCSRLCQNRFFGKIKSGKNHPMWTGGKQKRICIKCKIIFYIPNNVINKGFGKYCSKKCHYENRKGEIPWNKNKKLHYNVWNKGKKLPHLSGENSSRWRGGRYIKKNGYIMIYNPNHPFATSSGYVREHRLVMEKYLGRYLKPTEIVHHINEIVKDNRIENLKLFFSNSDHVKHHSIIRKIKHQQQQHQFSQQHQ